MAIVSDVEIRLRADIARLQQDLTRARQQVSGFTSDIKGMLGGLFAGFSIGLVVSQVVGAQREFEKLRASLTTVTGSSAAAGKAFEAIQKFAAATPYSVQEVTESFLKLRNLGLTPSERALMSYGNTASAMGKNLNQLVEAVADATTGEFERLKEFGIKAKQNGDRVALTFQGVTKTIGNNAAEIEAYLMAIGEVEFAGGMQRQADTLDGDLSNLADTWNQTLVAFSQSGFGDVVRGSIQALSGALSDLGAMFKAVSSAADEEGGKVEAIGPVHKFLTTAFEALTVVGVNVAYIFKTIGRDIGAFAAQAVALFEGGFKGLVDGSTLKTVQDIGRARVEDAKRERAEVDATSERILGAAAKNQAARAKEAEDRKKGTADALAQYKIQSEAAKGLTDEQKKAADAAAKAEAKRVQAYRELEAQVSARVASTARELEGLKELSEAEKFDLELTERIRLGKVKLTAAEEAHIRSRNAEAGANKVLADSNKEYEELLARLAKNARELADEREGLVKSAQDEAEQNEWLVKTFGMTEQAIIHMEAARVREQMVQKLGRDLTAEEISDLERVAELKERSARAVADRAELEKVRDFWTDIDQTARDTFRSIADGGKDLGQRLKETLKNTFFDWLYQQTLRKWIINVGTSVSGQGAVSGIANAVGAGAGGTGGMMSNLLGSIGSGAGIVGTVSNLYSSLAGGMTAAGGLGTGFIGSLAGGLNGAGIGSGLTSALGLQMGNAMAGVLGPAVSGAISSGLGALAAAAPWVAGAVALFTVAKKAFGHGPKEMTGTATLSGWINGSGGLDANMYADWQKKGGWLSSTKTGSDRLPIDAELAKGILSTYETIKTSTMDYAKALGLNADHIANRAQGLNIAFGKDQAANEKAITDFFTDAADHVAREVLPSMALFQREGETAAQTLQRMATNAAGVDQIFTTLGTTTAAVFGEVSNVSMLARERLVDMAGGVQNLAGMVGYFQQNILTEADRAKAAQGPLQKALESIGYASLKTTDDYKSAVIKLMESGALATEEGAKQYAGLLALAPQFKLVADYLAQTGDAAEDARDKLALLRSRRELEIQVLELEGRGVEALAARRALELEGVDASLLPLYQRVHALQDEKTAIEAVNDALANNGKFLDDLVDGAMAALNRAVQAQKDRVTAAYQDAMRGLEGSIKDVNATIERTGTLSKALRGAITAPDTIQGANRQVARAEITAALAIAKASGVLPTADSLATALATVSQDSSDDYATAAEYQRAVARTNAELEALGGMADGQLSVAERQLRLLEDQKVAAEAAYQAELKRLDDILVQAQAQVDALRGVDNSVKSVAQALAGFSAAITAAQNGPTPTKPGGAGAPAGSMSLEQMYQQVLGRAPDAAGLAWWQKQFGASVDQQEYMDFVKSAQTELANAVKAPPTVTPTASSGTMGGSSAMLAELQTLNTRMASMEASMANTANSTGQFAQQFNQVSGGGNALAVETF